MKASKATQVINIICDRYELTKVLETLLPDGMEKKYFCLSWGNVEPEETDDDF